VVEEVNKTVGGAVVADDGDNKTHADRRDEKY